MPRPTSTLSDTARFTLVTHIEELKAELSSLSCPRERRETQAQLKAAQAAIGLHSTEG